MNNPAVVKKVLFDGHEVGCHTMYHETVGEPIFDMPGANFLLGNEIKSRLELATDTVEKVAGVRPVSFRAPRLFGSTTMVNCLEELGYTVDSSFPSYFYSRSFLPYKPSHEDWSKEGDMRILELPVFYDIDVQEDDEKHRSRDQWPMLRIKGAECFSKLCNRMLRQVKDQNGNSVLCIYLHPWEFVEMPECILTNEAEIRFKPFLYQNSGVFTLRALDEFLGAMKIVGVQFTRMKDFAALRCQP
jgi:peptidoglycan/xylan/chitin deacetylase (PgdA/CDA1 family)